MKSGKELVDRLMERYTGYPVPLVLAELLQALYFMVEEECCRKRLEEWIEHLEKQEEEELEEGVI